MKTQEGRPIQNDETFVARYGDGQTALHRAVVVPLIRPGDAARALPWAQWLANGDSAIEVRLVLGAEDAFDEAVSELVDVVDSFLAEAPAQDVMVRVESSAEPAVALLAAARDRIVCMPTRARVLDAECLSESLAARLLARSTEPVLLVGPHVDVFAEPLDVAIAVSQDPASLSALGAGRRLARRLALPSRVVHVVEAGDSVDAVDGEWRIRFPDEEHASAGVEAIAGPPVDGLVDQAQSALVVLATHARTGLNRIGSGSITFDIAAEAERPVLAVGPGYGATSMPWSRPEPAARGDVVAVLDGSTRSLATVRSARQLAGATRRSVRALVVAPGPTATELAMPAERVERADVVALAAAEAAAGAVVTVGAFGKWGERGVLWHVAVDLVAARASLFVTCGPNVDHGVRSGPLVMAIDETATEQSIAAFDPVVGGARDLTVLAIQGDRSAADRNRVAAVARAAEERWGVTTAIASFAGHRIPDAIVDFAASVRSPLLLLSAHHHETPGKPTLASTSLAVAARASCPVAIAGAR